MSEITATIVVDSVQLTVTPQEPGLTITPETTELRIFTGGFSNPGGNTGEIQFNGGGYQAGIPYTDYSTATGNLTLGNVANLKILGGVNGYVLQTDGTGNLTWQVAPSGNVTGNGVPGGANTQIQFNNQGNFGGSAGLTFDNTTNVFTTPGNVLIAGDIVANDITANANITSNTITSNTANFANTRTTTLRLDSNQVRLGNGAGNINYGPQNDQAVAIGLLAGGVNQGIAAVALGSSAGVNEQQIRSVAIGLNAGFYNLGANSVAIGANADPNNFGNNYSNYIVINGTGANLSPTGSNTFTVKPIRNDSASNFLYYDTTTGEISYDTLTFTDLTVSGNLTATGNLTTTGTTTIQQAKEKIVANSTGSTGTINYDLLTSAIILKTADATANFTLNFRGNSSVTLDTVMNSNQSMTCTFINKNSTTAYVANVIQIDGSNITPVWSSLTGVGTGTPNGYDTYVFNIIKTAANTYTMLASRTGYA